MNRWPEVLKSAGIPASCSAVFFIVNNGLDMIVCDGKQERVSRKIKAELRALIARTYSGGELSTIPDGEIPMTFIAGVPGKLRAQRKQEKFAMMQAFGKGA